MNSVGNVSSPLLWHNKLREAEWRAEVRKKGEVTDNWGHCIRRSCVEFIYILLLLLLFLDYEIIGWIKELTTFENTVSIDSVEGEWKVNNRINERQVTGGKKVLDTPIAKGTIS
jgi:hypothetical protein